MSIKDGPLTERQTRILELLQGGKRHKDITRLTGMGPTVVRQEAVNIINKLGSTTTAQAVSTYATATAYRNAGAQVLSVRIKDPVDATEEHVNHVLEGIAALFQSWSHNRLPK